MVPGWSVCGTAWSGGGTWSGPPPAVVRTIQASISYDPTSAIAGHAAAAAPTRPWDQPWATFTASEAAMPSASIQRASRGTGSRCRAACKIDHRGRVHQAVDRGGLQRGRHAALAVLADHGVGVPVGDVRRDPRHGEHDGRRGRADRGVRLAADGGQAREFGGPGRHAQRAGAGLAQFKSRHAASSTKGEEEPGSPRRERPGPSSRPGRLLGGAAGAVEDAGGGADVHVERDAVVGVPGHAGHVGGVELPGEQGGGAEHVPQAVPGPRAVAVGVPPAGGQVGALEDVAAEVGRPPVLALRGGEDQPERVGAGLLLGAGLLDPGGEPLGERVAGRACGGGRSSGGACGSSAPRGTGARRPRRPCGRR